MKLEDFLGSMILIFLMLGVAFLICGSIIIIADTVTYNDNVKFSVEKCIDNDGSEFIDEYCNKSLGCSKWGIVGDIKCSEVEK